MSNFSDKDEMPRPEQSFETMKETHGEDLNESKRSRGSMPGSAPTPVPTPSLTDVELEQYSSLFDFDAAAMLDADWIGQLPEDIDQFNVIDPNLDLNAFPATISEQHPILAQSASANEPSSEPNTVDTPPADNPSHENFGSSQQVDFLNTSNETIQEEINLWHANVVATQANFNEFPEQNLEGDTLEFTEEDRAILDSFGPAIAEEISAKYSTQNGFNMAGPQSSQAPTAQDAVLQGSEQSGDRSNTKSFEDIASSRVQSKDDATTQDELDSLVEWAEKNFPSNSLNLDQYDETFLSAQKLPSSPMSHDKNTVGNHQGLTSQSSIKIQDSAPAMIVHRPEFHQNQAGAAQNRFEHNSLGGRGGYEYGRVMQMQSEDNWTHASPPDQYSDPSHGDFDAAYAPHPYPCLEPFGNNNLKAGMETQRAGNDPVGIENRVDNTDSVAQRSGNGKRGKASRGLKKRADWETRPDAARPRVRMTEEEYQWLRPNEGPRDVFETQRKKAAEERLKEDTEADALEKAGMPRPQPKVQKPYKGGIHIEVWEKESLNNRRRAQGKSGRDLFSEKPKLRGKRKSREMSEAEPQPESKKMKVEESDRFGSQSETRGMNEGLTHDEYSTPMPAVDGFNRGMNSRPCYAANAMTGQLNQGMANSGHINNGHINNNYGNNYGHFGNNNYISNHFTGTSFGNGMMSSGTTRNGYLGSMPLSGVAYPSVGQGSRSEYDGAHQARAVYSHNQPPGSFHSHSEQKATASYGRNSVPPPPYVESVEQFTNLQPQPPQRPSAPMYGTRTSAPQAVIYPANESSVDGGNGIPPYQAGQNSQVLGSIDRAYCPNQLEGMRSVPDSLIDPMLQSQAQFPVPSVMGAQTGEHALENYKSDDFDTQERRE